MVQGAAHAVAQGVLSLVQGQDFVSTFTSGLLGSYGASAFSAVAGKFASSAVGTIASGAILGGIGSELTGGNFWQGAITGGFVAGFNHGMHMGEMQPDNGYDKNGKKINNDGGDKTDYIYDDNGKVTSSTNVKISTFEGGEVSSNIEGYGYRIRGIAKGGGTLYDPSMDMFEMYVGGGQLKAGFSLMKMGVTNLSKAKLGIPILGKASKTVLESSLHYSKIYGYKKINLLGGCNKKIAILYWC